MIGKFEKLVLFISSYLPLYPLLIYKEWDKIVENVVKGTVILDRDKKLFIVLLLFLFAISIIGILRFLFTKSNKKLFIEENLHSSGDNVISYIMSYLVPMLSIDVNDHRSLVINLSLFIVIGVLYVRNDLVYLNPVLSLLGYRFYTSDSGVIILTRFSLGKLDSLRANGNKVYGRKLAKNLYLYKEKATMKE